jgi:ABC-2 type transport system permease protein
MTATVAFQPLPSSRRIALHTFLALLARDVRVLRKQFGTLVVRAVMQPLGFTFVFTYVMPKLGMAGTGRGFSTVLVPGLIAITITMQAIMAVTMPLLLEFTFLKEIEDRAMAPIPIGLIGVQKIVSGAFQGLLSGVLVFPIVMLVHAPGMAPYVHVYNWPLFIAVVLLACVLGGACGLLLGTVIDIQKAQQFFSIVVTPMTMLGCVYYPWAMLSHIRWLQVAVLVNPVVFISEGLRDSLTPQVGHMPGWAFLGAMLLGTAVLGYLGVRKFVDRVVG